MMRGAHKGGYILLEALVGMAVLSLGMIAVNRALFQAVYMRTLAQDFTQARFLAEEKMAEMEIIPLLLEGESAGNFGEAHPGFAWRSRVELIDIAPLAEAGPPLPALNIQIEQEPPKLAKLSVALTWTRRGQKFERVFETLLGADRVFQPKEEASAL